VLSWRSRGKLELEPQKAAPASAYEAEEPASAVVGPVPQYQTDGCFSPMFPTLRSTVAVILMGITMVHVG